MIKFLDLQKQYESIQQEIDSSIQKVISTSSFINGSDVLKFENSFAKFQSAKYCIGVANGTDALEIAIESLNLPQDGEIIVPANSFIATSEAVSRAGYKVVFADVDIESHLLTGDTIRAQISENTVAVIIVHLYGNPCNMSEVLELAEEFNLKIIEDCAQAHGAEFEGRKVGAIGDVGCFSFYPGKNLGAYGDAGAILTNDSELEKRCRMIANHGRIAKYDHEFEGRNSRLDTLQASILNVKLQYLPSWLEQRRRLANIYHQNLDANVIVSKVNSNVTHAYHLFVVRTFDRKRLQEYLRRHGVETGIHYPISLPRLKAYSKHPQANYPFKCAEIAGQLLSLPIGEHMSDADANTVVKLINQFN